MELQLCDPEAHLLCSTFILEVLVAWTFNQLAEGATVWACGFSFHPDDPVVGLVVVLELLAISDRNRCRGEARQEGEGEGTGL